MDKNALAILLGQNIIAKRKALSMTRNELAEKLEITIDAIMKIENGKMAPKVGRLQEIADTLGCSVSSLFHVQSENTDEKIREIAEALSILPKVKQEAVMKIMYTSIDAFKK